MTMFRRFAACILVTAATLLVGTGRPVAQTSNSFPLQLEAKIPLGDVQGRIDHMAIDLARQRLFVAELGNDAVGVVDLHGRKVISTLSGLKEPQGVGYVPSMQTLYVANAGDGSVRVFLGADYAPAGRIELGDDADNIRIDPATERVFVGYGNGNGGLAVIDPKAFRKIADIPLPAHPESFQLDPGSDRIFVNLPKVQAIAVVDRAAVKQTESWPMVAAGGNFPMALNAAAGHVLSVFRNPATLGVFAAKDGSPIASVDICGDADDVFLDAKRRRVYVSCGEGFLDVLAADGSEYKRIARIPTVPGARTSLLVPELDRLYLAVRATQEEPASIWVFRPTP
jgi:DNA-binding beta-propeller fold protein YncE